MAKKTEAELKAQLAYDLDLIYAADVNSMYGIPDWAEELISLVIKKGWRPP